MSIQIYPACPTQSASVIYTQGCKQRNWLFGV
uniref:Uncharacterized protein n=1 Tax=Arundo donax TaxID=35708 RepID=A0A0A9FCA2_ARUDO